MMEQKFYVNLDRLIATLDVHEGGKEVRYVIDLAADRGEADLTREIYGESGDLDVGAEPVERGRQTRTLNELKDDQGSFSHVVIWAVRGMWGIPLEFGTDKGSPGMLEAGPEPSPELEPQPAPEPARKRSR